MAFSGMNGGMASVLLLSSLILRQIEWLAGEGEEIGGSMVRKPKRTK